MTSLARTVMTLSLALAGVHASAEAQTKTKPDRNLITAEEIAARPVSNLHDLIKSRRPNWFSMRGSATFQRRAATDPYGGGAITIPVDPVIIVYVDDLKIGPHDVLRSMSSADFESLERLDAATATQRFGTGHEHGAILIRRRAR